MTEKTITWSSSSVGGFILSSVIPLLGIILCIIGLIETKNDEKRGFGLALSGLIISIITLIY
jgi:hypothetical protein